MQQTNTSKYKYKIQKLTNILPQIPDAGVGKGVPHEPLPHAAPPDRDGSPTLPHRETDQNLVPEQEDQVEEDGTDLKHKVNKVQRPKHAKNK